MSRVTRPNRGRPGRRRSLRTDFSDDYDTQDLVNGSEDNWDNEGGTFANPDPELAEYDDDFEAGYDEDVSEEFDEEYDEDDDWDDDEFEYDGAYAEDDDDVEYNQRPKRTGGVRAGSSEENPSLRKQMMLRHPWKSYDKRPSSMSRVRHSGISISNNSKGKTKKRRTRGSGFDNKRRYDW